LLANILQGAGKWITAPTEHAVETAYASLDSKSHYEVPLEYQSFHRLEALKQAATLCTLQANKTSSQKVRLAAKASPEEPKPPKVSLRSQFRAAETSGKFYLYDEDVKVLISPAANASEQISLRLVPALSSGGPLSPSKLISKLVESNLRGERSTQNSDAASRLSGLKRAENEDPNATKRSANPAPPPLSVPTTPEQQRKALCTNLSLFLNHLQARRLIFTAATTYGAETLRLRAASLATARAARNAGLLAAHTEAKKLWKAERANAQRARLEALKFDDLEGYMRLVQSAKSSQIDSLLAQTDACLRQLAARLKSRSNINNNSAGTTSSSSFKNPASTQQEGFSALKQSSENWNSLATAFNADISHQPELLTGGELREYQMRGLRWMVSLRDNGLNGILADEMGLGKTVQVIALVAHCLATATAANNGNDIRDNKDSFRWGAPFLIAAPASVLPNWENEFKRWAPSIHLVSYRGPAAEREVKFQKEMKKIRGTGTGKNNIPQYTFHVALTSYEYLMGALDRPRLASIPWSYIIIDEGHRLKNSGCKLNAELAHYRATNRLLLTGTPLQNGIDELWTLLNFLMPDLFSSADDFQTWFGGAMRRSNGGSFGKGADQEDSDDSDAEDDAMHAAMLSEEEVLIVTSRLHQVLRPFMLRRLKEAVAGELPAKVEHLVPCVPSPYQAALFSALKEQLQGPNGVRGVSNTIMEMRNICNHPLISKLHQQGVEAALHRHPLPSEVRLCAKLEVLDRILLKLKASGHRCLIFCTMTRLLDVLESYLEWRGLGYLRLDGSTSSNNRGALVDSFNAPDSPAFAFLLSVRAGGVGLNLQAADTVIFYDTDWNPQMDAQAAARAHRIGQTKNVLVLRLQTVGTVEERVSAVAADKRGMADRSITGGFFDGKTSAAERQKYLLGLMKDSGGGCADAGSSSGNLSDSELNKLLARSDEELNLFEKEDARLLSSEKEAWKKSCSSSSSCSSSISTSVTSYSRLASAEEVAPLVAAALAELNPRDPDEGKEFGRGKRSRTEKSYKV